MTALCEPFEFDEDPTALYRLYDAADVLIYVGITGYPARRMLRHAETQPWWPEVTRKTMVWYPTRDEAAAAETAAIDAEEPKYNVIKYSNPNVGRNGSARRWPHPVRIPAPPLGVQGEPTLRELRAAAKKGSAKAGEWGYVLHRSWGGNQWPHF